MDEKRLSNNLGFTLIELIVVFSIMAILSSVGIASFVSYSRSQSIQTAASNLELTLELAKSRASSQVKPSQCLGALSGYQVDILSVTTYSLSVFCPEVHLVQTVTLPDSGNIKFDLGVGQTTTNSVFFPVITSGVRGSGNIILTGYNQSRWVCIDSRGIIKTLASPCP